MRQTPTETCLSKSVSESTIGEFWALAHLPMVDDGIRTDEVQSTSSSSGSSLSASASCGSGKVPDEEAAIVDVVVTSSCWSHVRRLMHRFELDTSVLRKRWSFVKCNQGLAVSKDLVCQSLRVFHDDADFDMHFPPQCKCQKVASDPSSSCSLGDTSGLRVPLTKSNTMPKIGTHALDILGHVPCRQVPALSAAAWTVSCCPIPDKRRSASSWKIARRSLTWPNIWDGIGHVQPGRLSALRIRCTR